MDHTSEISLYRHESLYLCICLFVLFSIGPVSSNQSTEGRHSACGSQHSGGHKIISIAFPLKSSCIASPWSNHQMWTIPACRSGWVHGMGWQDTLRTRPTQTTCFLHCHHEQKTLKPSKDSEVINIAADAKKRWRSKLLNIRRLFQFIWCQFYCKDLIKVNSEVQVTRFNV